MYVSKYMPKKTTSPKEEPALPEGIHLPEGEIEGIIISEEIIEVEVLVSDDLEDEEFDSIFSGVKRKKTTPEEEEDFEDFNSYFFEE